MRWVVSLTETRQVESKGGREYAPARRQVSLEQHPRVVGCVGLPQPGSVLSTLIVGPNIKRNSLLVMSMLIVEVTILP